MKVFSGALLSTFLLLGFSPCYGEGVQNLIQNGGFEEGKKHWNVGQGTVAAFGRGLGRNQSSGVEITVAPKRRGIVTQNVKGFQRHQKYEVTAWIKADKNGFGTLTMDVTHKNGTYVKGGGFYHGKSVVNKDWTFFRQFYQHKGEDPAQHRYSFVLLAMMQGRSKDLKNPKATGKIWYDDIMVVPAIPEWTINQVYPSHGAITNDGGKVVLSNYFEKGFIPAGALLKAKCTMKYAGSKGETKVKNILEKDFITLLIPAGKPGAVTLRITLQDAKSGKVIGEKLVPLRIRAKQPLPKRSAMLDERGRLWVNGKKFMPLGVYCSLYKDGLSPAFLQHLDKIRNMGAFNCVMPYGISFYIRNDKDLLRLLDETWKRDMRLLLVVHDFLLGGPMGDFRKGTKDNKVLEKRVAHVTKLVGQHPGFLSYYGNDEMGVDRIAKSAYGRRLLNRYDPFHPVWGVSYQVESYHKYIPSADILAYDTYPIRKDGTNFHTRWFAARARSLTAAVWGVPQCYQRHEGVPLTVENMLSPCAIHIIYEARGFVFWTTGPKNRFEKGDMEKRWGMLAEVGKTLKGLEEFILSDVPGKKLAVKNKKEEVEAALLDNGKGEYRIVAAGIHKDHHSEIRIPRNLKLRSAKFGRLREIAPGRLLYEGGALTCDFGVLVKR